MNRRELMLLLSGAATCPIAARAQQRAMPARIGWLVTGSIDSPEQRVAIEVWRQALGELGYVEGKNIVSDYRAADNRLERLPELARELVELKVDLIVAGATPAGVAAQQATTAIPIVVSAMGDPVSDGLVASLARPGGNITGTTFLGPELVPKRMGLLRELLPDLSSLAVLWHPGAYGERTMNEMRKTATDAASALGLQLRFVEARSPDEFEKAFAVIADTHAGALFQFPSPMFFSMRRGIVELATKYQLPAMFNAREFVELGGLIGYGTNLAALTRRTAVYVDKILKGAKPADLPVEQPTRFELFINLKTAQALGLTVPQSLLARADEVIE
jgi:putative ABC transport system substrate-binding protein